MLFKADLHERIRSGEVTVAFRQWKRPTVTPGGTLQSPAGLLRIDELVVIEPTEISDADAVAAGAGSAADVIDALTEEPDRSLYRIRFHRESDDPRVALRDDTSINDDALAEIDAQLDRWDAAGGTGPWTRRTLVVVAEHPGTRSVELAERLRVDQPRLKRRVRQLKGLGLTESLGTGYRISARGAAYLDATGR